MVGDIISRLKAQIKNQIVHLEKEAHQIILIITTIIKALHLNHLQLEIKEIIKIQNQEIHRSAVDLVSKILS